MATSQLQVDPTGLTRLQAVIRSHKSSTDRPETEGGADQGPMGGELLLASFGCFMSTLLAAVQARDADVEVENVRLRLEGTLDGNPARFNAVRMTVEADHGDETGLEKLVSSAERSSIVANTLESALTLSVTLEGELSNT